MKGSVKKYYKRIFKYKNPQQKHKHTTVSQYSGHFLNWTRTNKCTSKNKKADDHEYVNILVNEKNILGRLYLFYLNKHHLFPCQ